MRFQRVDVYQTDKYLSIILASVLSKQNYKIKAHLSDRESHGQRRAVAVQLAKELDFETSTVFLESGDRKVTAENLERIASILHKDIGFFLDVEERKTTDVKVALRADKDLSKADQDAILRFIDLAKQNRNGKRRT